jgi:hypothetical protein
VDLKDEDSFGENDLVGLFKKLVFKFILGFTTINIDELTKNSDQRQKFDMINGNGNKKAELDMNIFYKYEEIGLTLSIN